jgi:hypothetical protein
LAAFEQEVAMGRVVRRKFTNGTLPPLQSIQQLPVQILPPAGVDVVPDDRCPIRRSLRRYGARSAFHPAHAAIAGRLRQAWTSDRRTFDQVWSQLDGEERSVLVTCMLEGVSPNRTAELHHSNAPWLMSLLIQSLDLVGRLLDPVTDASIAGLSWSNPGHFPWTPKDAG